MPLFLHLFFFIQYTFIHHSFINIRWVPSPFNHAYRRQGWFKRELSSRRLSGFTRTIYLFYFLIYGIKVLKINMCAKCGKILGKFSARARKFMFSVMSPFNVRDALANRCGFVANVRMWCTYDVLDVCTNRRTKRCLHYIHIKSLQKVCS